MCRFLSEKVFRLQRTISNNNPLYLYNQNLSCYQCLGKLFLLECSLDVAVIPPLSRKVTTLITASGAKNYGIKQYKNFLRKREGLNVTLANIRFGQWCSLVFRWLFSQVQLTDKNRPINRPLQDKLESNRTIITATPLGESRKGAVGLFLEDWVFLS